MVFVETFFASSVKLVRTVGISQTDRPFEIEVLIKQPLIAVGEASTNIPAFIVPALQSFRQDAEGHVNVFNVVFIALGDSVAIVVGQLLGAGNMKKARDTDNKMIAFSVMCCTGVALVMLIVAPFFPKLYNTNLDAQELAKYFIMIMAIFMPQNAFLHASYFTLRSGGKTIITFLFDSVFVWCVSVPIAYCLSRFTGLHVLAVFAMVQVGDILKCIVGFVLVKKGVWMQNIVSGK